MNEAVLLSALGIVGACFAGLIWVIKFQFEKIIPALDGLKNATDNNTEATKSADTYLRERNGRDAKMHVELIASIKEIPKQIIDTADKTAHALMDTPISQHVEKQEVKHQVVVEKKAGESTV